MGCTDQTQVKKPSSAMHLPAPAISTRSQPVPVSFSFKERNKMFDRPQSEGPVAITFQYLPDLHIQVEKLVPGRTATLQDFSPEDTFQSICLAATKYDNNYWRDGRYNANQFLVKKGRIGQFQAFQISPPQKKPTQFMASEHLLCVKIAEDTVLLLVERESGAVSQLQQLKPNGSFVKTQLSVSKLEKEVEIVVVPKSRPFQLPKYKEQHPAFEIHQGKWFPSKSVKIVDGADATEQAIKAKDCFFNLAVYAGKYDKSYWTDGRYNNNRWRITRGQISLREAYRVQPPLKKFTQFLGSQHFLGFKGAQDSQIYLIREENQDLFYAGRLEGKPREDGYYRTTIQVSTITAPFIVFLVGKGDSPLPGINGLFPKDLQLQNRQAKQDYEQGYGKKYQRLKFFGNGKKKRVVGNKQSAGSNEPEVCFSDCLGNLSVYLEKANFQAGYNSSNYDVQMGFVLDYQAYTISPPNTKATQFLAEEHVAALRVTRRTRVYSYDSMGLKEVEIVAPESKQSKKKGFSVTKQKLSSLAGELLLILVPEDQQLSQFWPVGPGLRYSQIDSIAGVKIQVEHYQSKLISFRDPLQTYNEGPGSHGNIYSPPSYIFRTDLGGQEGMLHLDSGNKLWLWHYGTAGPVLVRELPEDWHLICAGSDGKHAFLLTINSCSNSEDKYSLCRLTLSKVDSQGRIVQEKDLDTSKDKMNIHSCSKYGNNGNMQFISEESVFFVVLSKTMTRGGDGLNHQNAIVFTFSPESLELVTYIGQTCSHQFQSTVSKVSDGLLAVQLGDNFPRGVYASVYSKGALSGRVVFTLKTCHYSDPSCGKPPYPEISTGSKRFYKGSNDNCTYSELGCGPGPEDDDGYCLFFVAQKGLDNSKTGSRLNVARDVAMIKLSKTFAEKKAPHSNWVTDEMVVSQGPEERAFFYDFGGGLNQQRNKGVIWLTRQTMQTNASRLKVFPIKHKKLVLLLYEIWSETRYRWSEVLVVDYAGRVVEGPRKLPLSLPQYRSDSATVTEWGGFLLLGKGSSLIRLKISA